MAVDVLVGFRPDTEEPIDSRFIASNASDRLSLVSFNCYKGLLVFQQDTSELYVCIDPSNPSLESSWNLIDGSESSSTGFPFTGNALITGSLTISGSNQNALGGTLTVSDTIFTDVISASIAQFTGDGVNSILLIKTSEGNSPITINPEGLIVFDEFTYTPTPVNGGFLYSGSEFFIGLEI